MQTSQIYVLKAHLITLKTNTPIHSPLTVTLRLGRATATAILQHPSSMSTVPLELELSLHVDKRALQTQRCTVTLNGDQRQMLGIAVVTLPKEVAEFRQSYRLIQSKDKYAELNAQFTIAQLESVNKVPEADTSPKTKNPVKQINFDQSTMSRVKSAHKSSMKPATSRLNFQEDTQLQRLKKQKQAYYQLYQLQKAKCQKAALFVSSFVSQISSKYPDLLKSLDTPMGQLQKKKILEQWQSKQAISHLQQLEQANRSLHRQVEEYKTANEKLKKQLFASQNNTRNNNILPNSGIFDLFPGKNGSRSRSRICSSISPVKSQIQPSSLGEVDLKKWLQQSVGQRQQLQKILTSLPKNIQSPRSILPNLSKIRTAINRAYVSLLSGSSFARQALLNHKRQVNSILDELITV